MGETSIDVSLLLRDFRGMPVADFAPDIAMVAARLTAVRQALNLSKAEFADAIEVDRSSWVRIEKGQKVLQADHAYRIAVRYGVPMDFIYRGVLKDIPASLDAALRAS